MMFLLVATVVMNIYITVEVFFVYSAEMALLVNGPPVSVIFNMLSQQLKAVNIAHLCVIHFHI